LGTTNSAIAVVEGGEPRIVENVEGNRTTPSMVAISRSNERLVGLLAKRQAVTNSRNTIFSAKRLIGRKFSDKEVQRDRKLLPYEIRESSKSGVEIKMAEKWYRPEEISAMILQKLKNDAEKKLGESILEAIITVPAYFDDAQRKATKDAGEIAGFKVHRIINEPTAAALAYGLNKKSNEQVVVYDFGGGTFDISVLDIGDNTVEVKATGGDTHLGGDDFDQKIIDWIIHEFKKESGIDVSNDHLALQRLKEAAEKAKHELSSTLETEINIPFITSNASGPQHLLIKLSRSVLESIVHDYIERSLEITKQVVADAGLKTSDIDEIILVGGQTRMPAIHKAIKGLFNKEANHSINPDEVVALGAAIEGGVLRGDVKDILLLDITPLSLGLETLGGVFTKLIEKNTAIPTSRSQVFSTAADNQTSVEIHVLQGEREMASGNKTLGRFILDNIPPAPRGVPQVDVTFDIDTNGILSVKAKDKATNKEQSIRIEATSGLSKEEIDRMKKEAEVHTEEDKKKRETVEVKNAAESLIYSARKSLQEAKGKVDDAILKDVESKVEALEKLKDGGDVDQMKQASETLSRSLTKIGETLYKKSASETQPSSDGKNNNGGPEVKDVEHENVKDDKKDEDKQ